MPHTAPPITQALRQIARSLSSAVDLDTTLDLIARKTAEVMAVDSCTIYLLDPESDILRLRASTGLAARALGRSTLRVGEGMTGHAVRQNAPVYATLAQADPHYKPVEEADEGIFQSLLAVPLAIEEQPIGAMNVQNLPAPSVYATGGGATRPDCRFGGGALAKAQLYDSQHRQLQELQTPRPPERSGDSPNTWAICWMW
ncbi:MAG: GAF domain-containing protein [Chloroflexi bacterium]|nr:GAF domain-containing protein [Chloroflexota bacterium]